MFLAIVANVSASVDVSASPIDRENELNFCQETVGAFQNKWQDKYEGNKLIKTITEHYPNLEEWSTLTDEKWKEYDKKFSDEHGLDNLDMCIDFFESYTAFDHCISLLESKRGNKAELLGEFVLKSELVCEKMYMHKVEMYHEGLRTKKPEVESIVEGEVATESCQAAVALFNNYWNDFYGNNVFIAKKSDDNTSFDEDKWTEFWADWSMEKMCHHYSQMYRAIEFCVEYYVAAAIMMGESPKYIKHACDTL